MFIQIETMPDPADLKFLPGRQVLTQGTLQLRDKAEAVKSPLAQRLFELPDVSGVAFGADYITVTKGGGDWRFLKPAILGTIMDHFASGAPVIVEPDATSPSETSAAVNGGGALVDQIREALRRVIDPELGYNIVDLGLIYDVALDDGGAVRVTMTTTTPGCPATDYLMEGSREAAESTPGVASADVTLTYDPRWGPEMMSPEAKAHFGIRDGDA